MATQPNGTYGVVLAAEDFKIGDASGHSVSRFRVHMQTISGTVTVKGRLRGDTATIAAVSVVTTVGLTTVGSTITATGFYDLDASGFELTMSSGTSCTFSYYPMEG